MERSQKNSLKKSHWWQRWWDRLGVGVLLLVLIFVAQVGWTIYQQGDALLGDQFSNQFTASGSTPAAIEGVANLVRAESPTLGARDAILTIVEFSDFECPFCRQSFPTVRRLASLYEEDIQIVYRHFPVASLHNNAVAAAEASMCAHEQGKFWSFHDRVFQNQEQMTEVDLLRYAQQVGVDTEQFLLCVNERRYKTFVEEDMADGVRAGVRGTPTWFINGRKVEGAVPEHLFVDLVERLLAEIK